MWYAAAKALEVRNCEGLSSSTRAEHLCSHGLMQDHLWSARVLKDDPEVVQATHLSYFEAGEDEHLHHSSSGSFMNLYYKRAPLV